MTIDRAKFEWNLNTIIAGATLIAALGTIATTGYVWANTTRDIQDLKDWQTSHIAEVKDRFGDNKAFQAKVDERFHNDEGDISTLQRKQDNLEYRTGLMEKTASDIARSVNGVQDSLNDLKSDMRVVKDILQRKDAATSK